MDLTKELIAYICRQYDLGEARDTRHVAAGEGFDRTWKLITTTGTYILRRLRRTEDLRHALFVHEILEKLHDSTFPYNIPVPVKAPDDGRTIIDVDDGLFWVYPILEGSPGAKPTQTRLIEAAHMLALMHMVGEHINVRGKSDQEDYMEGYAITGALQKIIDKETELGYSDAVARHVRKKGDKLLSIVTTSDHVWNTMRRIPTHSHVSMDHLIYNGDKLIGVVDFENVVLAPRLNDVAYLMYAECREGGRKHRLDFEKAEVVLKGYKETYGLSMQELAFVPLLLTNIAILDYVRLRGLVRGKTAQPQELVRAYKSAMWFYEKDAQIAEWARKTCRSDTEL